MPSKNERPSCLTEHKQLSPLMSSLTSAKSSRRVELSIASPNVCLWLRSLIMVDYFHLQAFHNALYTDKF